MQPITVDTICKMAHPREFASKQRISMRYYFRVMPILKKYDLVLNQEVSPQELRSSSLNEKVPIKWDKNYLASLITRWNERIPCSHNMKFN